MYSSKRIFNPYSIAGMKKSASHNTICETLREAYKAIEEGDLDDAKYKIRVAVTMGKAMSTKLKSYNPKYADSFFARKNEMEEPNGS